MNKEPDFFSNITPTSGGLIIIALGVLLYRCNPPMEMGIRYDGRTQQGI